MRRSASLVVAAMIAGVSLIAAPQGQRGAPPPAASLQQQPKGTGVIAGQVIDAGTNLPIAGAAVMMNPRLAAARAGGPGPGAAAGAPIRLITGADGRFVIRDLLKGSYVINASADGYLGGSTGQARPGATSEPVDVGDGERVTDVRIRLWKNAVVTGTVVDEAGEPAVATPVRVFRKIAVAGRVRYTPAGFGTTDDRGMYRISALSPGDYVVAVPQTQATMPSAIMDSMLQGLAGGAPINGALMDVMSSGGGAIRGTGMRVGDLMLSSESGSPAPASDGRIFAYQTVLYPAAVSLAQASLITLRSGEERSGIDLQLKLAPTFRVSGTVSFPGGTAGVLTVRLAPATDDGAGDLGFDVATAATRPDGTFTFLGVPPGQFFVRVVKPPRPPIPPELANNPMVQMAFGGAAGGSAQGLFGEVPLTVGGSDINDVAIVLSEGAKLTGRLIFDGALAPPQAQQLRSISITLQAADGRSAGTLFTGFQQSAVGPDATFKTPNYPAGKYLINAGNGGQGWIVRSIIADGRDVTNEPLELRDADVTNVVITYTDKVAQVSGTVHVAQGAAIASGSTVFMFPADYRARIANTDARRFRNAAVSKTGAYTFGGLASGDYLVAALDGDEVPENRDTPFFDALSRVATHVTIGEGEKKTQDLQFVKVAR